MFQNHQQTLPIPHVQLKTFGHTRENSPEFLRAPMARVVQVGVLGKCGRLKEHCLESDALEPRRETPKHIFRGPSTT
jgi:hypothetical protein